MTSNREVSVREEGRLDKQLAREIDCSRSQIQTLIENEKVKLNGDIVTDKSHKVNRKSIIEVEKESPAEWGPLNPHKGPLEILHEDEHLLAVNKPSGLLVHPTSKEKHETLANRIVHYYSRQKNIGPPRRAGLVHRLDRGTSGVILAGRTEEAIKYLKEQFHDRSVRKTYRAIVDGPLDDESILIDVPVGRHRHNPTLRQARPDGKHAETVVKRVATGSSRSAIMCRPKTGRTHQIRVHCQYIGHPIIGDDKYGLSSKERLMLHAESITLEHPERNKPITVSAEPPPEVMKPWNALKKQS